MITDDEGEILDQNKTALDLLPCESGDPIWDFFDANRSRIEKSLQEDAFYRVRTSLEGVTNPYLLMVFDESPCRIFLFQKRFSKRQNMLLQEQRKWMNNLRVMLFGISHELKSPLATARGYTEYLKKNPDSHDMLVYDQVMSSLDRIGEVLSNVTEPVESIRSSEDKYARFGDHIQNFKNTISIMEDTKSFIGDFEVSAKGQHKDIYINMKKSRLFQVLINLFRNAQQATNGLGEDAEIKLITKRCEKDHHQERCVVIEFSDNGEGMTETAQEKVFTPYFSTRGKHTGSGLGGYFIYSFVRNAGGSIDVKSSPGEGATFDIHLPYRLPSDFEEQ